jgi:O-succinylbenzoic acid--CoA ligase
VHTWASVAAAARGLQRWLGGGPIHSVCFLPLSHVSGLMQVVRSFVTGGQLMLAAWPDVEGGGYPAQPAPGAVTSLVPTQLARLLEIQGAVNGLRRFRAVFLGGAPAWPELLARTRRERIPLAPCYGLTETAAQVTTMSPEEFLAGRPGAGRALPHARVEIVDDAATPLPPGREGRIVVRASSLFHGY